MDERTDQGQSNDVLLPYNYATELFAALTAKGQTQIIDLIRSLLSDR